nr:hypothetical protein BaRGS_015310 [Batillaria attramentaria]
MATKAESAPDEKPGNLKKCVDLLQRAETDNEKLAALLLVCEEDLRLHPQQVGGLDEVTGQPIIVEIDETKYFHRKYHRGQWRDGHWVFGGIERESGKCFMVEVPDRSRATLEPIVLHYILPGSHIIPDGWRAYGNLAQAPASELKKQITIFNEIITAEPSEDDELEMFKQTQMDCYTVLTELAVMQTTCQLLIDKGTPAALVDVITRGQPDEVKAMEVLIVMLRQGGPAVWSNSTSALNRLLTSLTDQVAVRKDEGLFGMCDILAFMLTMGPKENEVDLEQKWVKSLVSAVTLMVKSKLGVDQRQRVLRLISSLVDYAGVECLVPPVASEPKVLLLVTHLAAIEIRMATENCTEQELHSQMGKLVSYYSLLENIIQYVIVDEELDLHHKQLAQLHTGMAGALNGVVYLLTRVAKGTFKLELRNPIVVASLRILGVWMAEEPEALKDEVIDLVPFLA